MTSFEFIVLGIPVSQQSRRRKRVRDWKETVLNSALNRWPPDAPPMAGDLKLTITYYYESVPLDVDNIIKPVQDALIGVVYDDDGDITDTEARKRDLTGSFRVKGMSKVLADGFCSGEEFIHVRIENAPDHEEVD